MNLNEYPSTIAESARKVLELSHELAEVELKLAEMDGRIDAEIAFDPELKNDLQRKTKRVAITLQDEAYRELIHRRVSLSQNRDFAILVREQLEREFKIAILQERRAIAELENLTPWKKD